MNTKMTADCGYVGEWMELVKNDLGHFSGCIDFEITITARVTTPSIGCAAVDRIHELQRRGIGASVVVADAGNGAPMAFEYRPEG